MSSCLAFMSAFISMATWRGSTESRRRSCEEEVSELGQMCIHEEEEEVEKVVEVEAQS